MQTPFSMILSIVNNGHSGTVMSAAREAGAKGGTVIHSRATGTAETESFLGIAIEPEKEIVLIVVREENRKDIMTAIYQKAGLSTAAAGIILSLPVETIVGAAPLAEQEKETE